MDLITVLTVGGWVKAVGLTIVRWLLENLLGVFTLAVSLCVALKIYLAQNRAATRSQNQLVNRIENLRNLLETKAIKDYEASTGQPASAELRAVFKAVAGASATMLTEYANLTGLVNFTGRGSPMWTSPVIDPQTLTPILINPDSEKAPPVDPIFVKPDADKPEKPPPINPIFIP